MAGEDQAFWAIVDRHIDARIEGRLSTALANHRPRGAASIALSLGSPGTPIVASVTTPWLFVKVDFPVLLDSLHIVSDVVGAMTFDLWVQRAGLGQVASAAASIVNGNYPALSAVRETTTNLATAGWSTRFIEPGSIISAFATVADGVISVATLNLKGRRV